MPHIPLPADAPGIISLMKFRPDTAGPLNALAEVLLRGPSSLSRGERELVASVVSTKNGCRFCASSHSAFASAQLDGGKDLTRAVCEDYESAPISNKLKRLLDIASQVQRGGKEVTEATIAAARSEGATDVEIHDTVLIAAAFCMYNRYVDGLATVAPTDPEVYDAIAKEIVTHGYTAG